LFFRPHLVPHREQKSVSITKAIHVKRNSLRKLSVIYVRILNKFGKYGQILVQKFQNSPPPTPKEMKFHEDPSNEICVVSYGQRAHRNVFAFERTPNQKGTEEVRQGKNVMSERIYEGNE